MPFLQNIPPSPFPTESKRLFYSSLSLLLSRMQGYHNHLSKFHMFTVTLNCIPSLQVWIHRLGPLPLPPTVPSFSSAQFSSVQFSSVQSLSRVWLFVTPWNAACQASLSITNSRSSLRLTSIESVMPSSHLMLCRLLLLRPPIPPFIRVFSNEPTLHMRWPKYWSFRFSIIPSKEIPGLISFRMDWLDLLAVQGTLKRLLQHHRSKASIFRDSAFFTVQLISINDHRKHHSLD